MFKRAALSPRQSRFCLPCSKKMGVGTIVGHSDDFTETSRFSAFLGNRRARGHSDEPSCLATWVELKSATPFRWNHGFRRALAPRAPLLVCSFSLLPPLPRSLCVCGPCPHCHASLLLPPGAQAQFSARGQGQSPPPPAQGKTPNAVRLVARASSWVGGIISRLWETPDSNHNPLGTPSRVWTTAPKAATRGPRVGTVSQPRGVWGSGTAVSWIMAPSDIISKSLEPYLEEESLQMDSAKDLETGR